MCQFFEHYAELAMFGSVTRAGQFGWLLMQEEHQLLPVVVLNHIVYVNS